MIDISNFTVSPSTDNYDINLVQKEVGGGVISIEQIDSIQNYPAAKSIVISGLKQDTFIYFLKRYGNQFEAISFWKNKLVEDLSLLGTLKNVKYINYFFNQRATTLWNMTNNSCLQGLGIYDFSRLHDISEIKTTKTLQYLSLGDMVWVGMIINSLKPIIETNIKHFEWCGKTVEDKDFICLAESSIEELDLNPTQFSMEELADLLAHFPTSLKGTITKPYTTMGIKDKDGYKQYYYLCKRKRTCLKGKDDERFKKYLKEFDELLSTKRSQFND